MPDTSSDGEIRKKARVQDKERGREKIETRRKRERDPRGDEVNSQGPIKIQRKGGVRSHMGMR
jgi:hypothetical protein